VAAIFGGGRGSNGVFFDSGRKELVEADSDSSSIKESDLPYCAPSPLIHSPSTSHHCEQAVRIVGCRTGFRSSW
jgi:hypothetical protein